MRLIDPTAGDDPLSPRRRRHHRSRQRRQGRRSNACTARIADGVPGSVRLAQSAHDRRRRSSASRCWSTVLAKGRDARRARFAELMKQVGLEPECARALSARLLRRPAPAHRHRARHRAQPAVIVADEATSALDVSLRSQVLDLLMQPAGRTRAALSSSATTSALSATSATVSGHVRGPARRDRRRRSRSATRPSTPIRRRCMSAIPQPDPRASRSIRRRFRYVAPDIVEEWKFVSDENHRIRTFLDACRCSPMPANWASDQRSSSERLEDSSAARATGSFVKVYTDEGITGIGECSGWPRVDRDGDP